MGTLTPAAVVVILVFAGLFGLAIGSFLNVVVYRVPAAIPLTRESRCPGCDEPVRPWQNIPVVSWIALRARCAECAAPISVRYPLVETATAVAFVVISWVAIDPVVFATGRGWDAAVVTVAYLYLAAISIALTLIDLDTRRLPDAIVLPAYGVLGVLFTVACALGTPWEALLRAVAGGAALFASFFLLRAVRPGGMGCGDVKLAGVLGAALAWIGWGAFAVGAFAAFVLGGVFAVGLMAAGRAGRRSAIPFGPWMIAGAWLGVFAGEQLAGWYVGMLVAG